MNDVNVSENFKQTFLNWFIGFLTIAIGGTAWWVIQISSQIAKIQSEHNHVNVQLEKISKKDDSIAEGIQNLRIELSKVTNFENALANVHNRLDLHAERMTQHAGTDWHGRAGIRLGQLSQRLDSLEKGMTEMKHGWLEPMKKKLDVGERYTLEMANRDESRMLKAIDQIHEQMARLENTLQLDINDLRRNFNALLNSTVKTQELIQKHTTLETRKPQ